MFHRPVDLRYPILAYYGERSRRFEWSMDPDNGLWIPVRDFECQGQHRGTDFDCPTGTPVMAMAEGIILKVCFENSLNIDEGAGLYILQLVTNSLYRNWVLKYSHLQASYVEPVERVRPGEPIAESGNSGAVLRPYLHVDLMNLQHQWKAIALPYELAP